MCHLSPINDQSPLFLYTFNLFFSYKDMGKHETQEPLENVLLFWDMYCAELTSLPGRLPIDSTLPLDCKTC